MGENKNVMIVQQSYANFVRGDIPGVLRVMSEDVIWKQPATGPAPFAGTVRGREQLGEWFNKMDGVSEVEAFERQELISEGNIVVVLRNYTYRSKSTGKSWESDWVMVWVVKNSQIAKGQIFEETLAQAHAFSSD